MDADGVGFIDVTLHCVARVRERYGVEGGEGTVKNSVVSTVRDALVAGRVAKRVPAGFCDDDFRARIDATGTKRVCWNSDLTRAYVLYRYRRPRSWVVLTALSPAGRIPVPEGVTVAR
jgi:hypothetical protein